MKKDWNWVNSVILFNLSKIIINNKLNTNKQLLFEEIKTEILFGKIW